MARQPVPHLETKARVQEFTTLSRQQYETAPAVTETVSKQKPDRQIKGVYS
jgi:hypothetical protein